MSKAKTVWTCQGCGTPFAKWMGKCTNCGSFEISESTTAPTAKNGTFMGAVATRRTQAKLATTDLKNRTPPPPRVSSRSGEFDRVLGGGLVEGSVILLGGEPGVGKSTLLLQTAARVAADRKVLYVSGEESEDQVQMRAERLGLTENSVELSSSNDCLAIADAIEALPRGSIAIIDSLQTMRADSEGMPGSVSQVKTAAGHLIPAAKNSGTSLILVNHVTKEGSFAGPNLIAHMVDATMFIESDTSSGMFRIMRTTKNRYGRDDEIGIFEMTETGMDDVPNPSEVFIGQRAEGAFGTIIFPSIEGTRPLLLEVQALVTPTSFGTGRRSAMGWDTSRLNMIVATISARLGLALGDMDIYLNVAGGIRVTDPAMDLAVVTAILSAMGQVALPQDYAAFGEVGLAGEVRTSMRSEARIREARKMGFKTILSPTPRGKEPLPAGVLGIDRIARLITEVPHFQDIIKSRPMAAE